MNIYKFKNVRFDKKYKKFKNEYLDYISDDDIDLIRIWRNNQIRVLRQNKRISKTEQKNYFYKVVRKETKKNKPNLILFSIKKNEKTIGYCGLVHISWLNKHAEISFLLDHKLKEREKNYKPIMLRSFNKLFQIGFNKLNLKKLTTETFAYRKDHINIYKILGMKQEGVLKKQYKKSNKLIDSILHAKFK